MAVNVSGNTLKKDYIISGANGFLGKNLVNYIKQHTDNNCSAVSRKEENLVDVKDQFDHIFNYQTLQDHQGGFESYIHLAGKVYDLNKDVDFLDYEISNVHLTKRIFDRFLKDEAAKHFVFMSTIHVLTDKPSRILDESYSPRPVTGYGRSKLMAEKYLLENITEGKNLYIVRPSMIHGPENKGNLNLLYTLVQKGLPYPFGSINNKRTFTSIDNLCFIILELINQDCPSGIYHVADDEPTYTHDLVKMIAQKNGRNPRILNIPIPILRAIARAGDYFPLLLNQSRYDKLTSDFLVSNQKVKNVIQKPLPLTATEGLKKTLESF